MKPSPKVLAGNWKMFKTRAETRNFFETVGDQIRASSVRKIAAPSPTLLDTALQASASTGIEIFAQNVAWAESGAFTGETSAAQLLDLGVKGAIIGHSERRQYFGETDASAVKRALFALSQGLHVIFCFGEKIEERQSGKTQAVIREQLAPVVAQILPQLNSTQLATQAFMLAYEPVWAIGTGLVATPDQVREAHGFIASLIGSTPLPILYGGSVKADNFGGLASLPHVHGGLVGGASLEAKSYLQLHEVLDKATPAQL
ncbi:MAG: triose-phosphate isomerase [Bdellovibrionales bacterium]|nr:triose-phosphate isomerase [Bdellovibrionales bacterium]